MPISEYVIYSRLYLMVYHIIRPGYTVDAILINSLAAFER